MIDIYNYAKNIDTREKYSQIEFSFWEQTVAQMYASEYIFFANEVISFSVGDDVIRMPLVDNKDGYKVDVLAFQSIYVCTPDLFPLRNTKIANQPNIPMYKDFSLVSIFGHDDSIYVSGEEFYESGANISIEWNSKEYNYELVISPPLVKIRTNESFSLTVDGSTPAFVLNGRGVGYTKNKVTVYTEHFGKIYNVLEIENDLVTDKTSAYNYLFKHNSYLGNANVTYSVTYSNGDNVFLDNNLIPYVENSPIFPQSLNISTNTKDTVKNTSNGFSFIRLGDLNKTKTLNELSAPFNTIREEQINVNSNYR